MDDTSAILELKDRFEQWGLTVQQAPSGKIFICRIHEGEISHDALYEDHFPVGMPNRPLSDRVLESIVEFVQTNKSEPKQLKTIEKPGNYGLYGASIRDNRISSELVSAIDEFLQDG